VLSAGRRSFGWYRSEYCLESPLLFTVNEDPIPALKRQLAQQPVARLEGWSQTHAAGLIGTLQVTWSSRQSYMYAPGKQR